MKDKYEQFLELLKNDPEAIEYQVIKNEYKELLDRAFEKAKSNKKVMIKGKTGARK